MSGITEYAALNARIRALKGKLLNSASKEKFSKARTISDYKTILEDTDYREGLPFFRMTEIEKKLNIIKIINIKKIANQASGIVKKLIECRLEKIETENLKFFLRLWHSKKDLSEYSEHIITERILSKINYSDLMGSGSIEDISVKLRKTPYEKPIINGIDYYKKNRSLFLIEFMLDRDNYLRLIEVINHFSINDKKIISDITCRQIDFENIINLFRYKKYYNLSIEQVSGLILPGGNIADPEIFVEAYRSETLFSLMTRVFSRKIAELIHNKIAELDEDDFIKFITGLSSQVLYDKVKKVLSGYPFTIGTVLGYLFLLDNDISFLISTANNIRIREITGRQNNVSS